MLEVTVRTNDNSRRMIVQLNNHTELNLKAARAALEIAFGNAQNGTVSDDSNSWRITNGRAKKVG